MRLFISYARLDQNAVKDLADILRDAKHTPWYDRGILAGENWRLRLIIEILRCDGFIYVITPKSVASKWCQREFRLARWLLKPVIPVILEKPPTLPPALSRLHMINVSEGMTASSFANILAALSKKARLRFVIRLLLLTIVVLVGLTQILEGDAATSLPDLHEYEVNKLVFAPAVDLELQDIAAANGTVWIATTEGLWHYHAAEGDPAFINIEGCPVTTLAVTPDGNTVWFSTGGRADTFQAGSAPTCQNKMGRYTAGESEPELFDEIKTTSGESIPFSNILTIQIKDDGSVWFGDIANGIFYWSSESGWQPLTGFAGVSKLYGRVEDLQWTADGVLWVLDALTLYRYQDATWTAFDSILPDDTALNMTLDAYNRLWVAHIRGLWVITPLSDGTLQTTRCGDEGQALAVTPSDNGRVMWVATESGYARIEVQKNLTNDCAGWTIQTRQETSDAQRFFDPYASLRLAVEQAADTPTKMTLWLLKTNTNQLYTLTYP